MSRNNIWKWLVLAVIAGLSFWFSYPLNDQKKEVPNPTTGLMETNTVPGKLRLGLDLAGGTSFVLGLDVDELRESVRSEVTNSMRNVSADVQEAEIVKRLKDIEQNIDNDHIIQVIRRRVDGMGVNEPLIQSVGAEKDHRVVVQIPGADKHQSDEARRLLQSAAVLEFRLLARDNDRLAGEFLASPDAPFGYVKAAGGYQPASDFAVKSRTKGFRQRVENFRPKGFDGNRLYGSKLVLQKEGNVYKPCFVERSSKNMMKGDTLSKASVATDPIEGICVSFSFNSEGAKKFGELTARNVGRRLAIILDNTLYSAPNLKEPITGGSGRISGSFTAEEARSLSNVLKAGALPAPMAILSESTVAPTLGHDMIKKGMVAAGLGIALVAVFMIFYYWFCGFVADVALFLNVVLLPFTLVLTANIFGAVSYDVTMGGGGSISLPVLTMPGIAGLVLTLGMAVDANVLIFERIREEFRNGMVSAGTAISKGFGRAFTAIVDSNITTILTGAILFIFGSGPVRGYAIVLVAGVLISMFTALVVTRLILEMSVKPESAKPFKMLSFAKNGTKVDFVGGAKLKVGIPVFVIVASLAFFFWRAYTRPASVLAVDLTGGSSVSFFYDPAHTPSIDSIQKAVDGINPGITGCSAQFMERNIEENGAQAVKQIVEVKSQHTDETLKGDPKVVIAEVLNKAMPESKFESTGDSEVVGSVVGEDLKKDAAIAVALALAVILLYVSLRFEFGFALGAVFALAHDALITLGLYSLTGHQVSLIVVSALLTIVGYSVNDTIVVFDRIREGARLDHRTPFPELCNKCINNVLSRTVITSITTLLPVLALFVFGAGSIEDFALAMLIGVIAGTYSSNFIAAPVMLWWYRGRRPQFEEKTAAAASGVRV